MQNSLDRINADAQDRFKKLKHKLKLDLQAPLIKSGIKIEEDKIQQLMDTVGSYERLELSRNNPKLEEAVQAVEFVDNSFNFIESLQLPPQLSLVIGMLIAYHKSDDIEELLRAKKYLKEFILMKGYSG